MKILNLVRNLQDKKKEVLLREQMEERVDSILTDLDKMIKMYESSRDAWNFYDVFQNETNVTIQTDEPVIILPMADLHIGHVSTDLRGLLTSWIDFLRAKNLFLVLAGDFTESIFLSSDMFSVMNQVMPIDFQILVWKEMLKIAPERILAANTAQGHQHDALFTSRAGLSLVETMLNELGIPALGNLGFIDVCLDNGKGKDPPHYGIASAHKMIGHSVFNNCHPAHILKNRIYQEADVAIVAHEHEPAMMEQFFGGKTEYLLRPPSMKMGVEDRYSNKFWRPQLLKHYCVVFWPGEKKIRLMQLDVAMQYIEWNEKLNLEDLGCLK